MPAPVVRRPLAAAVASLLAAALLTALLATLLASPLPAAAVTVDDEAPLAVTGYALGTVRDRQVARSADGLTTLTVVGSALRADGRTTSRPAPDVARLVGTAHGHGLRAEVLLTNDSNRLGGFDPRAAHRLLRSDANVRRVAGRLARTVVRQGWDGVNLDLELLRPADGPALVRLAAELQALMPAERTVSVDVSARTSHRAYRAAGYRLGALGRTVDVVQLMTYDRHGPTWTGPGPIGPLRWQRAALATVLEKVPAQRVDLGVAGYGYTWPRHGTGRSVTVAGARALVERRGGTPRWRPRAGEWTARLDDGTVVWWSDARSHRARVRLAREHGLHGLAVWRIGSADPLG